MRWNAFERTWLFFCIYVMGFDEISLLFFYVGIFFFVCVFLVGYHCFLPGNNINKSCLQLLLGVAVDHVWFTFQDHTVYIADHKQKTNYKNFSIIDVIFCLIKKTIINFHFPKAHSDLFIRFLLNLIFYLVLLFQQYQVHFCLIVWHWDTPFWIMWNL